MKWIRIIGVLFWSICTIITVSVLLTEITFTGSLSTLIFIFITTSGLPLILLLSTIEVRKRRAFIIWFFALITVTTIGFRISTFINFGSGFKTQTITHRSVSDPEKRIEFQLDDLGAFGYNKRTVIVSRICCFLQMEQVIDPESFNYSHWKLVNEDVNELGLKFP
ncbi:MAG: hypothetical protein QE487_06810 [Fluviicola sp.]|nr:hypothetical protein [Fluviicola sp.]